jgi:hypothetical protein
MHALELTKNNVATMPAIFQDPDLLAFIPKHLSSILLVQPFLFTAIKIEVPQTLIIPDTTSNARATK